MTKKTRPTRPEIPLTEPCVVRITPDHALFRGWGITL